MKKHKKILAIGLVALSLTLSGCGTQLYELTADEEEIIVQYAAYFVAKHNVYQKDGASNASMDDVEESESSGSQDTEDTQNPEDTQTPSGSSTISIAEAMGVSDTLAITYTGSSVEEYIKEGAGYVAEPSLYGNRLYVVKMQMKNISDQAVEINNLSEDIEFELDCNNIVTGHRETFLSSDLSTYVGTLEAGQTVDVLLIFEAQPADAQAIVNPTLQITIDGVTKNVEL